MFDDSSTKGLITHLKRHPVEEHAYLELKKKEQNEQSRKRKADESGENFIQTKTAKLSEQFDNYEDSLQHKKHSTMH